MFVRHGDPLPHEWMARHPGWVRFPATLVPRPVPRQVVPGGAWGTAGMGEAVGGPTSRPVSVGTPVVRRRRVPSHRLPTGAGGMDTKGAIGAYRQASETVDRAASTYLASVAGSAGADGHEPTGRAAAVPDGHKGAAGRERHAHEPVHRLPAGEARDAGDLHATYLRLSKELDRAVSIYRMADPPTADQLRAIMPNAGDAADRCVGPLSDAMAAHGIATAAQRAAFLAQIALESEQLHRTEEDLNYTPYGITRAWPRLFPTDADAAPYAHNSEALSNRVYAGKIGNGDEASGDSFRYRGRGFMQVTGRANYRAGGFEDNPDAMAEPQNAADSAAKWWQNNGLDDRSARPDAVRCRDAHHQLGRSRCAEAMGDLPARSRRIRGSPMKRLAAAAAFLGALSAAQPSAADFSAGGPRMSESLCRAPETALLSCRISTKVVSIRAQPQSEQPQGERTPGEQAQGGAVYRFGRLGHIELGVTGLHYAEQGFSGGGETQIYADTPAHRTIVFEEIVRTAFGADGRHDPQADSGLFVQRGRTIVSSRPCTEAMTFSPLAEELIPQGDYVPH